MSRGRRPATRSRGRNCPSRPHRRRPRAPGAEPWLPTRAVRGGKGRGAPAGHGVGGAHLPAAPTQRAPRRTPPVTVADRVPVAGGDLLALGGGVFDGASGALLRLG